MNLPSQWMEQAVNAFAKLPGIGKKTALRLVLHLLKQKKEEVTDWTWKIDDSDLVHLSKLPTASQSRHLLKRARFPHFKLFEFSINCS